MQLIATFALSLIVISSPPMSHAIAQTLPTTITTDPMERERIGKALVRQGKHADALEHYLWCFDHGLEHDEAYYGVRLSFLLSYIKELGEEYPPALEALRERMRNAEQALLAGKGTPELAHDYGALCRTLEEIEAAVATLRKLSEQGADTLPLRDVVVHSLIDELVWKKQYEAVLLGIGDDADAWIDRRVGHARGTTDMMKRRAARSPLEAARVAFVGADFAIQNLLPYYTALIGANRHDLAQRFAHRILDVNRSRRTINGLVRAARDAGAPELADELLARTSTRPATSPTTSSSG